MDKGNNIFVHFLLVVVMRDYNQPRLLFCLQQDGVLKSEWINLKNDNSQERNSYKGLGKKDIALNV